MVGNFILSENRNTYGGLILASDFCTDYKCTGNIAERIATDWQFDEQCKKNAEARKRGNGDIKRWR